MITRRLDSTGVAGPCGPDRRNYAVSADAKQLLVTVGITQTLLPILVRTNGLAGIETTMSSHRA